eukprot:Gb_28022 [translate_table: standard]
MVDAFKSADEGEMAVNRAVLGMDHVKLCESLERQASRSSDCKDVAEIRPCVSPSSLHQTEKPKRPPSRLQMRAPASLEVKLCPSSGFTGSDRSPIPLLSPLLTSPLTHSFPEDGSVEEGKDEEKKPFSANLPVNGWQHPAAPFFNDVACSINLYPIRLC